MPRDIAGSAVGGVQLERRAVERQRVQGLAQVVARGREKAGPGEVGELELPPLCLRLAEQPRIVYGQSRLGGKGLEEIDDFVRKASRLAPRHDQGAEDFLLAPKRNGEHGAIAEPGNDGPDTGEN